jgi:hypothetical protein
MSKFSFKCVVEEEVLRTIAKKIKQRKNVLTIILLKTELLINSKAVPTLGC